MVKNRKSVLGKGISSLFRDNNIDEGILDNIEGDSLVRIKISDIIPNKDQPRKLFNEELIEELSDNIKKRGVLQPIILRKKDDKYEIIAGERRYRASKMADLETIPAIIKDFTDEEAFEISILENLHRKNLNSIEEAEAIQRLRDQLDLTNDEIAKKLNKGKSTIFNILRILQLPEEVKDLLRENKITSGQVRSLINIRDKDKIIEIVNRIMDENLSARQVEKISKGYKQKRKFTKNNITVYKALSESLEKKIGTKVKITNRKISIDIKNKSELERILKFIEKNIEG